MKKHICTGIAFIVCVALCAIVWPQNAEVDDLPVKPNKNTVITNVEAKPEEMPQIVLSADNSTPSVKTVAEGESPKTEVITAEEKTEPTPESPVPAKPASEAKSGDKTVIELHRKPHYTQHQRHQAGKSKVTIPSLYRYYFGEFFVPYFTMSFISAYTSLA